MTRSQEAFKASIEFRTRCLLIAAVLATALGICGVARAGLLDGLQLHVEFENNVLDSSPNGYDGQSSGGLQFSSGVIGQAGNFDGIDDQVLFPGFSDALLSDNDFTIAYWFNVPTGFQRSVLSKRAICSLDPFIDIRMNPSRAMNLEVSSAIDNYFISAGATTSGWHHAAFTRTGAALEAFLNGQLVDQNMTPASIDFSNTAVLGLSNSPCVGSVDGTQMLMGGVDDLRIYNRVLTDFEIFTIGGGIFANDFESGDTSDWSSSVP